MTTLKTLKYKVKREKKTKKYKKEKEKRTLRPFKRVIKIE